jgi:lipopolysaccharide export system protein LptA
VRRTSTTYSGARSGVRLVALWAGLAVPLAGLMLVVADARPAHGAQPPAMATAKPGPVRSAKPAPAAKSKKGSGPAAAGGNQTGDQNSPFGMLQFSSNNGPIQIKADSLNLDYKDNWVEFKGNVHATQSGTTLTSKTLKVLYGEKFGQIKQVIALGDVKMTQGGRSATGQRAVLDEVKHTVEMTGEPVIHDGPDSVAGRRIIIYLDSQKSFVEGASAVIFPRQNNNGKPDREAAD